MTNQETVKLVLREVEDKIAGMLPPCIDSYSAVKLSSQRHGVYLLASGLIAALYAYQLNDGVESTILWDSGVAQHYQQWEVDQLNTEKEVQTPDSELMFHLLEKYLNCTKNP